MDNFIDKLAQKFTAGEVIKANQAAEEGGDGHGHAHCLVNSEEVNRVGCASLAGRQEIGQDSGQDDGAGTTGQ